MTLTASTVVGDYIFIAADQRSMRLLPDNSLQFVEDGQHKIDIWEGGGIAFTGESVLGARITNRLKAITEGTIDINQIVMEEVQRRYDEGLDYQLLLKNTLIFSLFNGTVSLLYSLHTDQFVDPAIPFKGLTEIKQGELSLTCANIPVNTDHCLTAYQALKPGHLFSDVDGFLLHHLKVFKALFQSHSRMDACVSPEFDVILQEVRTGNVWLFPSSLIEKTLIKDHR